MFERIKKSVAESLSFGPKSTAIKILHRILELDQKNKTTSMHEEAELIKRLSDALETAIDYKKYQNLHEEYKTAIREAIACELYKESKESVTNCIHYVENNEFQCAPTLSRTRHPQSGLAYNKFTSISEDVVTHIDEYHTVQFPDNFLTENLVPHIQHALGNIRFFSKNLLLFLKSAFDTNSFFTKAQIPQDVIYSIGKNMFDFENSHLKL